MKKLARVTEAEVIAEFLKAEFYQPEFHSDRERFRQLVQQADLSSEPENALRRALLFRRRGPMWRELPADTQWWEVELAPHDLSRICVFPRAQWRSVAKGSFLLADIVDRIRSQNFAGKTADFVARIQSLSFMFRDGAPADCSSVLLIGLNEASRLTIIEGNHRMTAALLASPQAAYTRFRVFCGLSPRMDESCWYRTSVPNLWRYAQNRLKYLLYDKEADVRRLQPVTQPLGGQVVSSQSADG